MSEGKQQAKEPAVASAEKFMAALIEDSMGEYSQTLLDPSILMSCPMGLVYTRPHVKRWISFESRLIKDSKVPVIYHGTLVEDGMRVAKNKWSIAGLYFTDTILLNPVLMIKGVVRVMERRPRPGKETELTNQLLLSWTGPYFAKYCGPKKGLNNRALVLPVLDYSYQNISEARELRTVRPKDAKEISDPRIALHFLQDHTIMEEEKGDKDGAGGVDGDPTLSHMAGFHHNKSKDEITIRAKNRDGDQAAIVIDRSSLGKKGDEDDAGKLESWEDQEVVAREQGLRFVASGIKLHKNKLTDPKDLDRAIKITVINAFYFLNWVDLSSNLITKIPDLSQYPIVVLYLHDNQLSDMKEVEKLKGLSQLQNLTLFGNPIQSNCDNPKKYKYRVLNTLWEGFKERTLATYTATSSRTQKKSTNPYGTSNRAPSPAEQKLKSLTPADMALKSFDHSVLTSEDRQCLERFSGMQPSKGTRPSSRQ